MSHGLGKVLRIGTSPIFRATVPRPSWTRDEILPRYRLLYRGVCRGLFPNNVDVAKKISAVRRGHRCVHFWKFTVTLVRCTPSSYVTQANTCSVCVSRSGKRGSIQITDYSFVPCPLLSASVEAESALPVPVPLHSKGQATKNCSTSHRNEYSCQDLEQAEIRESCKHTKCTAELLSASAPPPKLDPL